MHGGTLFGMSVAVKEMHSGAAATITAQVQKDIEHEFLLHYHLRHDNICEVLCFNSDPSKGCALKGVLQTALRHLPHSCAPRPVSMVLRRLATSVYDLLYEQPVSPDAPQLFQSPLSLRTRVKLLLDLSRGLAYLHSVGIMHLDVKSMNLMVSETGTAQLADFGLSKALAEVGQQSGDDSEEAEFGMGSLPWMAPEMIKQETPTPKADVFRCMRAC